MLDDGGALDKKNVGTSGHSSSISQPMLFWADL